MDKLILELLDLVNDLADWEVQRMSSSGADTVDKIYKVIDKINDFINSLNSGLGFSFFGIDIDPPDLPNIPRLARGGIVSQPTTALIGESGPEAVIPLSRAGGNLGQTNINVEVNAGMGADGAEIGREIVDVLRRYERSNGPLPLRISGFDVI